MTMKNTTFKLSLLLSGLLLLAQMLVGQTILTNTTLAAAVATQNTTTISLASATGVVATSTALYVADGGAGEAMFVNSVNGNTVGVTRGYQSLGTARPHAKSALVFIIPGASMSGFNGELSAIQPSGSCTRTTLPYLPLISLGVQAGPAFISDCVGGVWVSSLPTAQGNTQFHIPIPNAGSVTNAAALGTSTVTTAAELYCTEVDLPYSKLLTGLAPHIGATGGTDKWIVALYDSTGNLVANSAVAGATVSGTAYAWQAEAFTSSYYAVGPAQYYGCVQSNGTTATLDLIKTNFQDYLLTYKQTTAGTFGTLPAAFINPATIPTGFTTVYGPWLYVY